MPAKTAKQPVSGGIEPPQSSPSIRLRITRHAIVSAKSLTANPLNYRTHPDTQRAAVSEVIDQIGWVDEVLVNERTGHIIDGHLRVERAVERNEDVPVKYVDLTEDEEKLALATLDPLAALAVEDAARSRELLDSLTVDPLSVLGIFLETNATDAALFGLVEEAKSSGGAEPRRIPGQTQNLCIVIPIKNLSQAERAIASTGLINRADAMATIFRRQLDAVGQFDIPSET